MMSKLQEELKQSKPFQSIREELWLNLSRTASALGHHHEQSMRAFGLSATQYNVLRILRGAGEAGLCQYEIGGRLVAQVPDVPRILERMEKAGWVERTRALEDRRMVMTRLSAAGQELVDKLDEPTQALMAEMFTQLSDADMERMNELLVMARVGAGEK